MLTVRVKETNTKAEHVSVYSCADPPTGQSNIKGPTGGKNNFKRK
jgi:hypothetical protein